MLPSGVTWERVTELFSAALDHSPADRETFLTTACGDNAALMTEVRSLLRSLGQAGDFLEPGTMVGPPLSPSLLASLSQAPLFAQFVPQTLISGRYRVESLLGRGGAGEVYEAWDEELGIPVALKTLRFGAALGGDALRSLKQEAMLARAVVHPSVCRVYDLGCHGDPHDGVWFLTMEVLRGETLAERLRARGRFTPKEAWPLVEQMAAGLEAAHQSGVVHLDFKSGNVMLVGESGTEQAVITDFGLARTLRQIADDRPLESDTTGIVGTPAYMAPEQVRGAPAGPAADIYALGIVLYELVTGTLPFTDGTNLEIAVRRLEADAPSPRTIVPELDERWETVIHRCLEREPRHRFARAADVAATLAGQLSVPAAEAPSRIPHSLPLERDRFVGRDGELVVLERAVDSGARLVTLLGTGGMGKTRFAVHYGWRSLAAWPGGVWFCDFTEARDLNGIVSAMGKALGIRLSARDPVQQLSQAIKARSRCLVILDNSEQIVEHVADTVQRWSERAPEATFLTTSRERLGLSQETIVDLGPLGMEAGHELFVERATRLRPGIELSAADLAAAGEVVRLVEGMPLAIELAAARVRVMSIPQIAAAVQKRFRLLTGGPSERHETLAAVIDDSWELLHPWEKAAFAQCSVFEGGFTLEAAESVLDLSAFPGAPWSLDVVQGLVDKSLLRTWMAGKVGVERQPTLRFGMYVSLQEYARAKLAEPSAILGGSSGSDASSAAEERHGAWYGRYGTDDALSALDEHGGLERRRAIGPETENLLAAARRAAARGDGEAATATYRAAAAANFMQGPFITIIDLGRALLDGALPPLQRAHVFRTLAKAERDSGRTHEAIEHYAAALALHREMGDRSGEGLALGNMGNVYLDQGHMEEARRCLEGGLAIDRERGNRRGQGVILHALGTLHHNHGRLTEARTYYETALAIHRETGSRRSEATSINSLAALGCDQGRLEEGRSQFEAALAIYLELDDRDGEAMARRMLGLWHRIQGLPEEAARYTEGALTIYRDLGNRRQEGTVLNDLATLRCVEGRLEDGQEHAAAALEIAREAGLRRLEGVALGTLGHVHFQQGRIEEAREALITGEAILRTAKADMELAEILCARIELERQSGDDALARTLLNEVEALADRVGSGPHSELGRMITALRAKLA
jgi:predicted ATPase